MAPAAPSPSKPLLLAPPLPPLLLAWLHWQVHTAGPPSTILLSRCICRRMVGRRAATSLHTALTVPLAGSHSNRWRT